MTNSIVAIPEDLRDEFKIDADGKAYASFRAVARLCGTHESGSSIATLLKRVSLSETRSKTLEPLKGIDYSALSVPEKGIPDNVVSIIIQHAAFEGNETAQKTLGAFIAVGFRAWVQQALGWQPSFYVPKDYLDALKLLVNHEETRQKVNSGYPGLTNAYDACARESLPVPELPAYFYLSEWLVWKRIYLNHKEAISFGNFTASTVERDTNTTLKRVGRRIKYSQAHLPLLDESYKAWLDHRARKQAM